MFFSTSCNTSSIRRRALLRATASLAILAGLCLVGASNANAQIVLLPTFDPTLNDGKVGSTIVSGGAAVTLQGNGNQITPGISGVTLMTLADLFAAAKTTDPRANPANAASLVVNTGFKTQVLAVPDPITGSTRTVAVYSNANIVDTYAGNTAEGAYKTSVHNATSGRQYVDVRIGEVDATGGTLTVAIGTSPAPTDSTENYINMGMANQSTLFYANGTGTASSTINWQGTNQVNMGSVLGWTGTTGPGQTQTFGGYAFSQYNGTFTAFDGSSHTVNNAGDLQAYNTFLIGQLQSGALDPALYDTEFGRARTNTTGQTIIYDNGPPLPDEVYEPIGVRAVIQADGANAKGIIDAGARLDVVAASNTTNPNVITSGAMLATNGGTVINNGQLSFRRLGNDTGAAMVIQAGSHGVNNGVLNSGFVSGATGAVDPASPSVVAGISTGIYVTGANATFDNGINGILNVDSPGSIGVRVASGATASNAGVINVGVNTSSPNDSRANQRGEGVYVESGGHFTNAVGGTIYLGRQAQYTSGAAVADLSNGVTPMVGIVVVAGGTATNAGVITLGTLIQGSSGIFANAGTGAVLNSGTININGQASLAPLANYGINVADSTNVTNSGTINIAGVNGVGIRLSTTGAQIARATSSGTINVAGTATAAGLRNYGVWSEGTNSTATVSGDVNLTGIGAIGVHARNAGKINITPLGNVNFVSGSHQIGYFIYGPGSTITDAGIGGQDVSTTDSTLFRVENGAVFNGGSTVSVFTASGQGSTLFTITGAPSTFNSGNAVLNLTGQNSIGVRVDGGAIGVLANTATLNLNGLGSIGGIVDGQKHDLAGVAIGLPNAATELTNHAAVVSTTTGVIGFITQNQGLLTNNAGVTLTGSGSTGVVARADGRLNNAAAGTVLAADGTGVRVEGAGAQIANAGLIQASDGVAALHLASGAGAALTGAGRIVFGGSAHGILIASGAQQLTTNGSVISALNPTAGTGAGIENAGEISTVTLTSTTINTGNGLGIRTATAFDPASTVTMNVSGSGTGFAFQTALGGNASGNLTLGAGYVVNGTGAGATGIRANTTGIVNTAATVAITNAAGGAALVAGVAGSTTNTGSLTSISMVAPVVDLSNGSGTTFSNSGAISAVDVAHNAILGSSGGDTVNMSGGSVQGIVAAGAGTDIVNWTGGTLNGSIEMGAGNNDHLTLSGVNLSTTYHVDGGTGAGDTLTFSGITHRGGSFAADNLADGINVRDQWETINFSNGTAFTLTGNLTLSGSTVNIDATSTLLAGNNVQPVISDVMGTSATVNNAGLIDLTNGGNGTADRLTIVGNYVGQGGRIALNTYLDTDGAPSDQLVISGGMASGTTTLLITNAGGPGTLTMGDGIKVVDATNGAVTAAGSFRLGGRVAAGAYDYLLYQGGRAATGGNTNDQNWYLRNVIDIPVDPNDPTGPVEVPNVRVEVPTDMVIPPLAIEYGYAMLDTLHERVGETWIRPLDPVTEERTVWCKDASTNFRCPVRVPVATANGADRTKWASSGWARLIGERGLRDNDNFFRNGVDYRYTFGGLQAGLDIYGREKADGTVDKAGIYVGYGQIQSDVKGAFGGKAGTVDMDAYTVGGYWTHFAPQGWYTDAVVQGTWYSATAKSALGQQIKPNGFGVIASIEGGYAFKLGNNWTLEPQAQLAYQNVSFDSAHDQFGFIRFDDGDSLRGRLGLRLTKTWNMADEAKPRLITSWIRANVWHEFMGKTKTSFGGMDGQGMVPFTSNLGGTWGELGIGVSGQVSETVSLFGTAAYNRSLDNKGRESWDGRLGVTVKW